MKKIGLYPGTFNPIHNGHVTLANYFINNTELDEVWVVITPQNPFKKNNDLVEDNYRLEMANKIFNHLKNINVIIHILIKYNSTHLNIKNIVSLLYSCLINISKLLIKNILRR